MSFIPLLSSATRAVSTTTITSAYTLDLADRLVIVTSGTNVAVNLPEADATGFDSNEGLLYTVATWGSATAVLNRGGSSDTIGDGSATSKSIAVYSSITVTSSTSAGWIVVATSGTIT